jgi:hypothetical protein
MYHRYILNLIKSQWIFDGTKRKARVPSAIYTLFKLHIFRKKDGLKKSFNFGVGPSLASSGLINNFRLNIFVYESPKKVFRTLYD